MAKKSTTTQEPETEQVIAQDPITEPEVQEVISQEASEESEAEQPQITLNVPAEEPVQIGHGSRDFGRQPKSYEEVTESAPTEEQTEQSPQQDGGQEQA